MILTTNFLLNHNLYIGPIEILPKKSNCIENIVNLKYVDYEKIFSKNLIK